VDVLDLLQAALARIDEAVQPPHPPSQWAGRVASALRALSPSSALYACLLWQEERLRLCVLDGAGSPRADWAEALRNELSAPGPTPSTRRLLGHLLALAEVPSPGGRPGLLALAVPEGQPLETTLAARALLAACAQRVGLALWRAAGEEARARTEALATLADLGELAGPIAHEFNNFLNVLILHLAVLEQEVPEPLKRDLAEISRQGKGVAAVIQSWQRYRSGRRGAAAPSDLNRAVRAAVAALGRRAAAAAADVRLELHPGPLPVPAADHDLERLCTFLVANAAAAAGDGRVLVRTGLDDKGVQLRVEDSGPAVPAEALAEYFELAGVRREGLDGLELAACKSMVRRLQGNLRAEKLPEGGVAVTAVLPSAPAAV
jgi:signal transduction histidine kinase